LGGRRFFPAFGDNGRWLYFTAAAIRNANHEIIGAIETLQDVTARKQAEAALHDSTAFLTQIIDGSSVATLVINADHRVTHWNHACEVLTGMAANNVIGTDNHWKAFYARQRSIMADLVLDGAGDVDVGRLYHGRYRPSALVQGVRGRRFLPSLWRRWSLAVLYGRTAA
jgi:PAS domain-containing protein